MEKKSRILVTGGTGMVGSAMVRALNHHGFQSVSAPSRDKMNLQDSQSVDDYFNQNKPEYVFMIAAKVGGINANISDPVGFLQDNLEMEINLFKACHKYKTKRNLFLGSSCVYPRNSEQPMKEEYLLQGELEPTNEGYALSKIVGLSLAKYYFKQFGMITVCPMFPNIYGTNDHFDLEKSHVLSALVKRFEDANKNHSKEICLWGTGIARREFMHVDDVANACLFLMESQYQSPEIINMGVGEDVSIYELAYMVRDESGYGGSINWDATKPDGMLKKCLDVSRMKSLGFIPKITLKQGLMRTIQEYREIENIRKKS